MRVQRPGEIDYYEELGVERNARPEEIRDSFRALARLLHPDHQQDEHLKSIAEKQLRRVNRIYAVLSDPERRRRYDELLAEDFTPPTIVFSPGAFPDGSQVNAKKLISRFVWAGAAVLGVAIVIWVATDQPSVPVYSAERQVVQAHAPAAASQETQDVDIAPQTGAGQTGISQPENPEQLSLLRAQLRAMRLERDEARRELAKLGGRQPGVTRVGGTQMAEGPAVSSPNLELTPPHIVQAPARPAIASMGTEFRSARPPLSEAHQFAGFWYFARGTGPRPKNLYPPEFIEATLTETNGVVRGRYRSRYQIVDRAISPDVNFEFTGTPAGMTLNCAWSGAGGAKGQLTLRMTGENDLKVDWSASEIGTVQGLSSGTAVLTRRID
jgi:curved DNA-binding protein CbpA